MANVPDNMKFLLFGVGPKPHAITMLTVNFLGTACLIVGIVGSATDKTLGLDGLTWLVLAIALEVWGLAEWLIAYFGAKEG